MIIVLFLILLILGAVWGIFCIYVWQEISQVSSEDNIFSQKVVRCSIKYVGQGIRPQPFHHWVLVRRHLPLRTRTILNFDQLRRRRLSLCKIVAFLRIHIETIKEASKNSWNVGLLESLVPQAPFGLTISRFHQHILLHLILTIPNISPAENVKPLIWIKISFAAC